jgi:hypothetical protein
MIQNKFFEFLRSLQDKFHLQRQNLGFNPFLTRITNYQFTNAVQRIKLFIQKVNSNEPKSKRLMQYSR